MRKKRRIELERLGQLGQRDGGTRKDIPKNPALVKVFLDPVFKNVLQLVRRWGIE
jgi:hypothetical protein